MREEKEGEDEGVWQRLMKRSNKSVTKGPRVFKEKF